MAQSKSVRNNNSRFARIAKYMQFLKMLLIFALSRSYMQLFSLFYNFNIFTTFMQADIATERNRNQTEKKRPKPLFINRIETTSLKSKRKKKNYF